MLKKEINTTYVFQWAPKQFVDRSKSPHTHYLCARSAKNVTINYTMQYGTHNDEAGT